MSLSQKSSRQALAVVALTLAMVGLWWWASPRLLHMAAQAIPASRVRAGEQQTLLL